MNTVLIVEDDWQLATHWREALEREGFRVVHETTAEAAIACLNELDVSVVITDIAIRDQKGNLSDLGGFLILSSVALTHRLPPKVLAVTGVDTDSTLISAFNLLDSASALRKPIDTKQLIKKVHTLIEQRDAQVRLKQEAEKSERELRRTQFVADNAADAIFLAREDGSFFYANRATCQMLGYSSEELLKLKIADISQQFSPSLFLDRWSEVKKSRFLEFESKLQHRNGSTLWAGLHVLFYEFDGEEFVVVMARDITARKNAERELRRYARDLERANKALEDFAFVTSHDMKQPLRAVAQLGQYIDEDAGDVLPEKSRQDLKKMLDRVDRLDKLLDDLLNYARAGKTGQDAEDIDLKLLVESVASLLQHPPGFNVSFLGPLTHIRTHRVGLEQALRNLIDNAIKHHDRKQGRVAVTAELDQKNDQVACFTVSDDGPGIEPGFHEGIFEAFPFSKKRTKALSNGMGLAIVKRIVESRGGKITLKSEVGKGTEVRFSWILKEL